MTKEEILKKIQEQLINQLGFDPKIDTFLESSKLDYYGADDLDGVEFIMAMEKEFDFIIPDDDAFCRMTFTEMVDYIFDEIN